MAIPTSVGGHVVADGIQIEPTRWSGSWDSVRAMICTSAPGGTLRGFVRQDNRWTIEEPYDTAIGAVLFGLEPGAIIGAMYFLHGASGLADFITSTTVLTVERVNDTETDVPRVRVSGEGGTVALDVAAP